MEIGQQQVDRAKAIAGRDEDRGLAGKRLRSAVFAPAALSSSRSEVVPTATMRPPFARAALSAAAVAARDAAPFGMHLVSAGVVGLDRQEGAGADMQRDLVQADAALARARSAAPA